MTAITETNPDFMNDSQLEARAVALNLANRELYGALDGIQNRKATLDRSLSNMGLKAPDCATAYRAVFHATLNAELAWEAARQEYLLWLRQIQKQNEDRYAGMRSDVYHYTVNHSARLKSAGDRAEHIAQVAKMDNPFSPDSPQPRSEPQA